MKELKIVVIGGGSSYTPELVEGLILRKHQLPIKELWLVDIQEGQHKLDIITSLTKRMIHQAGLSCPVFSTLNLETALENADFVATQIRVGFLKARELDESIPLSHHVLGQETNGPGGFFKALRTIPVILKISHLMSQLCPEAWLINFTNPASMVTEAVHRYGSHKKVIGLCNVPISMQRRHINQLNLDPAKTLFKFVGLNHNVFLCDVLVENQSILPQVMQDFIDSSKSVVENIEPVLWEESFIRSLGAIPCPYHRYYFKQHETLALNIEKFNNNETRAQKVSKVEQELFALYQDPTLKEKPKQLSQRGGAYYSDAACNLMASLYNDTKDVQTLNVKNNGTIPFLDSDSIIECSCVVGSHEVRPIEGLKVPNLARGLLFDMKQFEQQTIDVAVSGDREKAIATLTTNRLVSDDTKAKVIFEELLQAHKSYLPQFFK